MSLVVTLKGLGAKKELIGGKPPVVVQLSLSGSQSRETVNYGHQSRGTRNQE
jgi:hypothetical protein